MSETDNTVFALLLRRMDEQDAVLREILTEAKATNGRVTALETAQAVERAVDSQKVKEHDSRAYRLAWLAPTIAGVLGAFGAVVLAHFLT